MNYSISRIGAAIVSSGEFSLSGRTVESCHTISVDDPMLPFAEQLEQIISALDSLPAVGGVPVFMRFFLSDPACQTPLLRSRLDASCPVSIIGQAPLNGTKIAAWVWCRKDATVTPAGQDAYKVAWHGAHEIWLAGALCDAGDSYSQAVALLDRLADTLSANDMTLYDDCARTWLFVQNIDVNYHGVVNGRNSVFDRHNLTPDTHFIASTGIEGRTASHANLVMLDAVGVKGTGISISHLYGATHLNRTSEYGVRFERGAVVEYPDMRHVFISGTASIDNRGQIMHEGDIVRQTDRMIENVQVLLAEAGCSFDDVAAMTVYLRAPADYAVVNSILDERFPRHPRIITLAPVCRPGWLVEMECVAFK